ncbi:MAG: triacylglycerol lipase [Gammaproteobacteria bacterium]|jgi:triacylglycerol lipase
MSRSHFLASSVILSILSLPVLADCVVLLHGLARTSHAMSDLETALVAHGFAVANVDYPSRHKPIEELAPLAVENGLSRCAKTDPEKIHFVTHSMGGILIRYYLENAEIANLGRVVMIAPPNHGSEVVDNLANVPGFALVNGPAGLQLGTDVESIPSKLGPVNYPVGIIAGNKTFNPILSQFLPNPDDGKVSVESTKVDGMEDFIVVNVSHPFIMQDELVIAHTIAFINTGSFNANSP